MVKQAVGSGLGFQDRLVQRTFAQRSIGWPGQPAIVGDRIYFGSAGARVYALNSKDGSLIWSYKTGDSAKSSPAVAGDRLVIGNLDNSVYSLNVNDGTLIWKFKTGFEADSSPAIIDDR